MERADEEDKTYQQIAVLGIVEIILGRSPRRKPAQPNCFLIMLAALKSPRAVRASPFSAVPRVWRTVLITSSGVVTAAATAPARPPAIQCVKGSYPFPGFITFDNDSYAMNCDAVKGIVMQSVVG